MKILRTSFFWHCISNCLDPNYIPLDTAMYGWKLNDNTWEPIWFEGKSLPHQEDLSIDDEVDADDEIDDDDEIDEDDEAPEENTEDNSGSSDYLTLEDKCSDNPRL